MTNFLVNLRCELLGCAQDEDVPACHYCSAHIYDGDYVQYGRLEPVFRLYWRVRRAIRKLGPKHCAQCGKKFVRGYDNELCSEACHDNWLPF
jgi:hypothetical protein